MGNGKQRPKKERFLQAVALTGNITTAAQAAGCDRCTHYKWMEGDEVYPERFTAAMEQASDLLEQEARRRAVAGVDKPVYRTKYDTLGKPCGTEVAGMMREYSDTLLIFLMKGAMPEKYRERHDYHVEQNTTIGVILDGDFYQSAARLHALPASAPAICLDAPGEEQGSSVRPAVGKNGTGANGDGHGPRTE